MESCIARWFAGSGPCRPRFPELVVRTCSPVLRGAGDRAPPCPKACLGFAGFAGVFRVGRYGYGGAINVSLWRPVLCTGIFCLIGGSSKQWRPEGRGRKKCSPLFFKRGHYHSALSASGTPAVDEMTSILPHPRPLRVRWMGGQRLMY